MARIRITGCPKMQQGGIPPANTDVAVPYSANGMTQWQGQGIDFRSPNPYAPQMPMMNKPLLAPQLPSMGGDGQATYGNYGEGANYEAVGNGAAGDVFANAHGNFQFGGTRKTSRIRITGIPSMNEQMATGGYANKGATHSYGDQQSGYGYALNRNWGTPDGPPGTNGQKQPFAEVGRTLPESDGGTNPEVIMAPEMGGYFRKVKK